MIREVHFPDVPSKFPVRISRELGRKEPLPRGLLGPERRTKSPKTAIFPVLSLMIREFSAESGLHMTGSSASQSYNVGYPPEK
jgi:hypothetical protein